MPAEALTLVALVDAADSTREIELPPLVVAMSCTGSGLVTDVSATVPSTPHSTLTRGCNTPGPISSAAKVDPPLPALAVKLSATAILPHGIAPLVVKRSARAKHEQALRCHSRAREFYSANRRRCDRPGYAVYIQIARIRRLTI